MTPQRIGILHPGEMGISVAAAAQHAGHEVYWTSEGRSAATRARAERFGLREAATLSRLCTECTLLVSVCPPHAAETLADEVVACGFRGLYLDANAIAPRRALRMAQALTEAGASFVDGGIIGGPAWEPGRTRLYLAGPHAGVAAACFSDGPLEARVLGDTIGAASALKMCYAAQTKGAAALLCAVLATAERLGVREALEQQWEHDDPGSAGRASGRVRGVTAKAWRFAGEMDEIAATFSEAGQSGEFHAAAAAAYRRLGRFKDASPLPGLEEVLEALLCGENEAAG